MRTTRKNIVNFYLCHETEVRNVNVYRLHFCTPKCFKWKASQLSFRNRLTIFASVVFIDRPLQQDRIEKSELRSDAVENEANLHSFVTIKDGRSPAVFAASKWRPCCVFGCCWRPSCGQRRRRYLPTRSTWLSCTSTTFTAVSKRPTSSAALARPKIRPTANALAGTPVSSTRPDTSALNTPTRFSWALAIFSRAQCEFSFLNQLHFYFF